MLFSGRKIGIWGFAAKTNGYRQRKSGGVANHKSKNGVSRKYALLVPKALMKPQYLRNILPILLYR